MVRQEVAEDVVARDFAEKSSGAGDGESEHKDAIVKFPASWVIPIVVLIVLSFPPLGGHEIVGEKGDGDDADDADDPPDCRQIRASVLARQDL
jgi:hypothetical protein